MCIRPTSETLFSDYYSGVLKSYKDLPMKYNQWCSVLRWEKETRPFLEVESSYGKKVIQFMKQKKKQKKKQKIC